MRAPSVCPITSSRLGCRTDRGLRLRFTPFSSCEDMGFGADARSSQGRAVFCAFIGVKRRPLMARTDRVRWFSEGKGEQGAV